MTTSKYSIFNNKYEIISKLGSGLTSNVYLCREEADHSKQVALKLMKSDYIDKEDGAINKVEKEFQIMRQLDHPNINRALEFGIDGGFVRRDGQKVTNLTYIMLDYVPNGALIELCQKTGKMGESKGRYYFKQLTDAVNHMHSKNIVHCDLKPENILIDQNFDLQIADFGVSSDTDIGKLSGWRGTKVYTAPEIHEDKSYDGFKIDVFALGVILFIMVQGKFPFKDANSEDHYYKLIQHNKLDEYFDLTGSKYLSSNFRELFLKMVAPKPEDRITLKEIIEHPWMAEYLDNKLGQDNQIFDKSPTAKTDLSDQSQSTQSSGTKIDITSENKPVLGKRCRDDCDQVGSFEDQKRQKCDRI